MSVSYLEVKDGEVLEARKLTACYSDIFGNCIKGKTTHIYMYEPRLTVTEDECAQWIKAINNLGFNCKYLGKNTGLFPEYINKPEYHVFVVDISKFRFKEQFCSALTLARYAYEGTFGRIITEFLKIRKELPRLTPFKALQLAHCSHSGDNHSVICTGGDYHYTYSTRKELFKAFAKHGNVFSKGRHIHECWQLGEKKYFEYNSKQLRKMNNIMNTKEKKVYVVGGSTNYANWLPDFKVTKNFEEADLVMFTGGEDVDPSMYNQPKNPKTRSNLQRDVMEKGYYQKAVEAKKFVIGICRGSQFLCAMAGGHLVQHQENPAGEHLIYVENGNKQINITSTHHQAAYPYNLKSWDYKILGYTKDASLIHEDGNGFQLDVRGKECEIVLYRNDYTLGIQGHPEFLDYQRDPNNKESLEYLQDLVKKYISKEAL